MMIRIEESAPAVCSVATCRRLRSETNFASPAYTANSAVLAYQPDTQFAFLVDRLIEVNLYSIPTEIPKFTSVDVVYGA